MLLATNEPQLRVTWADPVTGRKGYLVVYNRVNNMATGGTRMRAGCTMEEVEDLARGMALKAAVFGLPVGGAKGGIDCDPKDPQARGLLRRFVDAMKPFLDSCWVTAEDLGVPQHLLDEVFDEADMGQSYHAAIERSPDAKATLARVRAGLHAPADGGYELGDVVGGYGVAEACLAIMQARYWLPTKTTVAIQGVGTMGGATAWYLHQHGVRVVAVADAAGTLYAPEGLDIPALLDARDVFGEIDRGQVRHVQQLPRQAILGVETDILVPAAVSYAITADNMEKVRARVVVEAANAATTPDAETALIGKGIPVIPGFVANAGAVVWAWLLLQGEVGEDANQTFVSLSSRIRPLVQFLMQEWDSLGISPREAALKIATLAAETTPPALTIP